MAGLGDEAASDRGNIHAAGDPSAGADRDSAAAAVLHGGSGRRGLIRLLPFLGPAFIASVAYVDPGNFATNIQGGAQFGYLLVWVIVAANVMAMLIQALSAKLGIATGRNLPEMIREQYPRPVRWVLWVIAEIVAMATDLAEFLGAAVAFNLLFGMPLFAAGIVTGITTFAILGLQRYGFRPLEAVIAAFVGVIALCYLIETILGQPDFGAAGASILTPLLWGGECPARDGHPRRNRDAACDLPALSAHSGSRCRPRCGASAPAVPFRAD